MDESYEGIGTSYDGNRKQRFESEASEQSRGVLAGEADYAVAGSKPN